MCVDTVESKYQFLNKCKLLFNLVVHQQQHLHWFWATFQLVWQSLREISPNITFYFVTQFTSKHNFYFEMEGVCFMPQMTPRQLSQETNLLIQTWLPDWGHISHAYISALVLVELFLFKKGVILWMIFQAFFISSWVHFHTTPNFGIVFIKRGQWEALVEFERYTGKIKNNTTILWKNADTRDPLQYWHWSPLSSENWQLH